jgi:hypothetical protein
VKVLVTGSFGFIGQHVRKALTARGHETIGYDSTDGKSILDLSVLQGIDDPVMHRFPDAANRRGRPLKPGKLPVVVKRLQGWCGGSADNGRDNGRGLHFRGQPGSAPEAPGTLAAWRA